MGDLFCSKHIIGMIWVLVMILLLLFISKKLEKKLQVKTILKIGSLILIALEIIKYIYLGKDMSMFYFPIQFCSLMLYAYPTVAFGNYKVSDFVKPFAFSCGLIAGLIAIILPTNILGGPSVGWLNPDNFIYTLSFIYHGFMIYFSLYLLISKFYEPKYKDVFKSLIFIIIFGVIAIIMNYYLDYDYMMLNRGDGNPLQFLIGYGKIYYYLSQVLLFIIINSLITFITKLISKKHK